MKERPLLVRKRSGRLLAGVCVGLADHLDVPLIWVRVAMVIGLLAGGVSGVFYLFLFLTVPEEGETEPVLPMKRYLTPAAQQETIRGHSSQANNHEDKSRFVQRRRIPVAEILLGGTLLVIGLVLLLNQVGVNLRLEVVLPGLAATVGIGLTWWLVMDQGRSERYQAPQVLGALSLVAVGVIMFFITAREPTVLSVIGAAIAVLAGVALAIAPWLLRLNRELSAEKAAREREAERSEIAAHLHDSVLQTLALIQQQSQPGTEIDRLARGQERELREWIFRSSDGAVVPESDSITTELEHHAASLEKAHPVRFEVITVGARVPVESPIAGAAKEAMLNAAQHAGGEVTVYIEVTPSVVRIEINDRGQGFTVEGIEPNRLGVRESIIGRMRRAGGDALIRSGPGGRGTSVQLEIDCGEERLADNDGKAPTR